jgi:hypothetical protein
MRQRAATEGTALIHRRLLETTDAASSLQKSKKKRSLPVGVAPLDSHVVRSSPPGLGS